MEALLTVGLALGAMLIGLSLLSKRLRASQGARRTVSLTGQHAVHVVELDGERLLIGTGPSGSPRLLARLPAAPEPVVEPAQAELPSTWWDRVVLQLGAMRG